jgi:hypothetical protein
VVVAALLSLLSDLVSPSKEKTTVNVPCRPDVRTLVSTVRSGEWECEV